MAELLWKNTLVCAALEDQHVKSEVYKPKWIWGNELSLPSFINDENDAVTKRSFPPNFQAC